MPETLFSAPEGLLVNPVPAKVKGIPPDPLTALPNVALVPNEVARSNSAPAATVTPDELPSAPPIPSARFPALTCTAPVKLLAPLSVTWPPTPLPLPLSVSPVLPAMPTVSG